MYIWQLHGVFFSVYNIIISIFGRRVLFLAAKTGTPFHFFLLKVEWGAIFGPFRFWHDSPMVPAYALTPIFHKSNAGVVYILHVHVRY